MVFDNSSGYNSSADNSLQKKVDHLELENKASVLDRLFSFLLDYLILSPVVSFLILVFFKAEISVWKEYSYSAELQPTFFLLALAYIFFFSLLQSLFAFYWLATPGQYFLKLKLQDEKPEGMRFLRLLLRQLSFWMSVALLGFPWLSVLAHAKQKTFYDRLSEFRVISLKQNQKYLSFEFETKYWQALVATFMVFIGALLLAYGWQQHRNIKSSSYTFEKMKKQNYFCNDLKSVHLKDRLQTVIALNLVGQITDECVDREADFVLWKSRDHEQRSLAYYAKSLTEKEFKNEERYLLQACDGDKTKYLGCKLADAFLKDDMNLLYKTLASSEFEKNLMISTLRYELGNVLEKSQDRTKNFQALKKYDTHLAVKRYLLNEILNSQFEKGSQERMPASAKPPAKYAKEVVETDLLYARKLLHEMQ